MESTFHPWLWGVAALTAVLAWVAKTLYDSMPPKLPQLPVVGSESDTDLSEAILEGYRKACATMFSPSHIPGGATLTLSSIPIPLSSYPLSLLG